MKNKLTKRDIKFFVYGMLVMLIVELIVDFGDFKKGWNDAIKDQAQIESGIYTK